MPEAENPTERPLAELRISDPTAVEELFAKQRERFDYQLQVKSQRDKTTYVLMRNAWVGRKSGVLASISENWLRTAPPNLKPVVGKCLNELRNHIETRLEEFRVAAEKEVEKSAGVPHRPDLTLPGYRRCPASAGSFHPITRVQREIEDIFLGLGYSIETGPEVETAYYNFDALNIPATHPARDDMDSLYVDAETVLRTHTSPVQIRALRKHGAPLYILAPGKAYRRDNPDATHSPMFHQVEGLAVDTDTTFADLKGTLDFFCRKFFGEKVRTSFHPSYFPFTEPSGEVSISCFVCDGAGSDAVGRSCRTCKASGWIEVMGCGMVHPEVLRHGGVDPERYSGWAFGLGIDRFAMVKYDIHDIQLFFQSDMRFLEQF